MANGSEKTRYREIAPLDLARFEKPVIEGNRGIPWRAAWYLVNAFLFQGAIFGLAPSRFKAAILRAFGAKVGRGLVCKPRVSMKHENRAGAPTDHQIGLPVPGVGARGHALVEERFSWKKSSVRDCGGLWMVGGVDSPASIRLD